MSGTALPHCSQTTSGAAFQPVYYSHENQMNFATLDTVTLQYVVEGRESGPPLVFVNSLGTDLRIWDGVVPRFKDRFRIVRYDKRGHGLSDAPEGPYTIAGHAGDLHQLLQHLEIDNPIVVGL